MTTVIAIVALTATITASIVGTIVIRKHFRTSLELRNENNALYWALGYSDLDQYEAATSDPAKFRLPPPRVHVEVEHKETGELVVSAHSLADCNRPDLRGLAEREHNQ